MSLFQRQKKLIENHLTWKIGGEAGFGIATSGLVFSKVCTRGGLNVATYSEYPSLIRGGHNTFQVSISENPIEAPFKTVDMLVALNKETIDKHISEVGLQGLIMYDFEEIELKEETKYPKTITFCKIPLNSLAKNAGADRVMRNTVALGASIAILDYNFGLLQDLFKEIFAKKGDNVIDLNIRAAKAGYDYIKEKFKTDYPFKLKEIPEKESKMLITGNEALGLGAIKSGVKFYAGYPMTPSSTILQYIAANQLKYDIVVKHTEDEISASNMAIGASYAGVRALTASSGGGFSLMVESLGLAAITETPLVIVNCQRPGPATGLPTWTGQADLLFVINASQDELPRIVIAPGDMQECFYTMVQAQNLAEKYQMLVIVLSDKYLSESSFSTVIFDEKNITIERGKLALQIDTKDGKHFKRYSLKEEDGVSPRSLPGVPGGVYLANSDEHDEYGYSNEEADMRVAMQKKRMLKLKYASVELPEPVLYGPQKADFTLFAWGSTKGAVLEAMKLLKNEKISVNFLHLIYIHPFPTERVIKVIENAKNTIIIEGNMTSQLGMLINQYTGYEIENKILKYDGRPFYPEELYQKIKLSKDKKGLKKWLA